MGSPAEVDVLVIFHSLPSFESGVDPSLRHVNVLFHMWGLRSKKEFVFLLHVYSMWMYGSTVAMFSNILCLSLFPWQCTGVDLSFTSEVHIAMEMGGFSPVGITEVPPLYEAEELSSLPLGRLGRRILHVVSWEKIDRLTSQFLCALASKLL